MLGRPSAYRRPRIRVGAHHRSGGPGGASADDAPRERRQLRADSRPDERGQAVAELALCVPLVAMLALAVVQVVIVAFEQERIVHTARDSARSASLADAAGDARHAAVDEAAHLDGVSVDVVVGDELVRVTLRRQLSTDVPIVGALIPDVTLTASAAMRREVAW